MSEFNNKPSYDEMINQLNILQMNNSNLNNEISKLKKYIQKLQDDQGYEICEYFYKCNSIKDTTSKYCFEDIRDCYGALVEYNGCSDSIQDASDYIECYKEIFGREYQDEDEENLVNIEENIIIEEIDNN